MLGFAQLLPFYFRFSPFWRFVFIRVYLFPVSPVGFLFLLVFALVFPVWLPSPPSGLERYCSRSSLRKPANRSLEGGLYSPVPRLPPHQPLHINAGFSSALRQIVCLPPRPAIPTPPGFPAYLSSPGFGSFAPCVLVPLLPASSCSSRPWTAWDTFLHTRMNTTAPPVHLSDTLRLLPSVPPQPLPQCSPLFGSFSIIFRFVNSNKSPITYLWF
ncbi:uncharacterized protein LOC134309861 [Trichomycterus rosablanca]|uniref:uncharacterized protein LOC134309861 n=1 Tax=Trichomycterus rosablanca TaxID=2290929 RepID=UPI002F354569